MNLTFLALGFVFLALGSVFFAQSKKEADEPKARNSRFAGSMMLLAAGGFLVAFALSYFGEGR